MVRWHRAGGVGVGVSTRCHPLCAFASFGAAQGSNCSQIHSSVCDNGKQGVSQLRRPQRSVVE